MSPKPGPTQSIALWHAHQDKCPYCSNPIDSFAILEVDHIIPERMLKRPDELKSLLQKLSLPGLDLNSYRNWLPAHARPCNRKKGGRLLPLSTLHNYLDLAARTEEAVLKEEQKLKRQALSNKAFDPILRLIEIGDLSKEEAIAFINSAVPSAKRHPKSEPLVLSFSLNIASLKQSNSLPPHAPSVPRLYDWLVAELQRALLTTEALFAILETDRNGESVSVRFASWMLDLDRLPLPLPLRWQLLEVAPYSKMYPEGDPEDFLAKAVAAKRWELIIDETFSDPLPYKRCEKCLRSNLHRDSVRVADDEIMFIYCAEPKCGWSTLATAN